MTASELAGAAVLFDMDGTLVDSTAVVEAVWAQFAERFDVDPVELLAFQVQLPLDHGGYLPIVQVRPEAADRGGDVTTVAVLEHAAWFDAVVRP